MNKDQNHTLKDSVSGWDDTVHVGSALFYQPQKGTSRGYSEMIIHLNSDSSLPSRQNGFRSTVGSYLEIYVFIWSEHQGE